MSADGKHFHMVSVNVKRSHVMSDDVRKSRMMSDDVISSRAMSHHVSLATIVCQSQIMAGAPRGISDDVRRSRVMSGDVKRGLCKSGEVSSPKKVVGDLRLRKVVADGSGRRSVGRNVGGARLSGRE